MSASFDPEPLQQLHALLEHFEHSPPYLDPPTAAALKRLILTRIRALEAVQRLASEARDLTQE